MLGYLADVPECEIFAATAVSSAGAPAIRMRSDENGLRHRSQTMVVEGIGRTWRIVPEDNGEEGHAITRLWVEVSVSSLATYHSNCLPHALDETRMYESDE